MIRIPVIVVRDNRTGLEHIVGTDYHDELIIDSNAIHYINMQCMESTKYDESVDGYDFVGEPLKDFGKKIVVVKSVTLEEFGDLYKHIIYDKQEKFEAFDKMISELIKESNQLEERKKKSEHKVIS